MQKTTAQSQQESQKTRARLLQKKEHARIYRSSKTTEHLSNSVTNNM